MADSKISALTDGAPAVGTDIVPVARGALTRRLTLSNLSTLFATTLASVFAALTHASRHENGGADEISVAGLSGQLADPQLLQFARNGVLQGTRKKVNFTATGGDVTFGVNDDAGDDEVEVLAVINDDAVTDGKLRDGAALSVIGRAANSIGNVGDIVAGGNGRYLQRNSDALSFAAIPAADLPTHATSHKSGGSDAIKLDELAAPTDVTTLNATTLAHGLLPKLSGNASDTFRGDGTFVAGGGSYTDENAQDAVGGILSDAGDIDFTYDDVTPAISAVVKNDAVTYAKMQNVSATSRVLGRISSGAGDVEELTSANLLTLLGIIRKVKSADEPVNNSDVLQNDDDLVFAVGANEIWRFTLHFLCQAAAANTDWKLAFTIPTGATLYWGQFNNAASLDNFGVTGTGGNPLEAYTSATTLVFGSDAGGVDLFIFEGIVIVAGTAGNVQLQWAQNSAIASDNKVLKGANLVATKLA